MLIWGNFAGTLNTISTRLDINTSPTISAAPDIYSTVPDMNSTAPDMNSAAPDMNSTAPDINSTFILTVRFGGQQGAGLFALVSQQCFISDLGIPAYIVEPFLDNSALYHTDLKTTDSRNKLQFSDLFDLDTFNRESQKLGYEPIVRLEYFLDHAPEQGIIVELQSGGWKRTNVLWDGYNTLESPCYNGRRKHLMNNITACVVRIVQICCVKSDNLAALSRSSTIMTTQELRNGIFGKWTSQRINVIIFRHWTAWWHIPITCKHSIEGKLHPSEQVQKHANKYRDTFLKSDKVVAFVLRFEHLILRNYNVDVCLRKFRQARENLNNTLTNASVFVAADLGKYQSGSWNRTFSLSSIDHERGEQIKSRFTNALSDFIVSQWKFDEWDKSFSQVTGGIEDAGYIATLQKSIASMADCLVFLTKGESSFQDLLLQEYVNYHPAVSEQCIHFLCTKDCANCAHFYTKQLDNIHHFSPVLHSKKV